MMPLVLDLAGDPQWLSDPWRDRVSRIDLSAASFWTSAGERMPLIVDGRGRYEDALALLRKLAGDSEKTRVLITDRESPADQAAAYLAGATRILVLAKGEPLPESALLISAP